MRPISVWERLDDAEKAHILSLAFAKIQWQLPCVHLIGLKAEEEQKTKKKKKIPPTEHTVSNWGHLTFFWRKYVIVQHQYIDC